MVVATVVAVVVVVVVVVVEEARIVAMHPCFASEQRIRRRHS